MSIDLKAMMNLEQRILVYVHGKSDEKPAVVIPNEEVAGALDVTEEEVRDIRASLLNAGLVLRIFGGISLTAEGLVRAKGIPLELASE